MDITSSRLVVTSVTGIEVDASYTREAISEHGIFAMLSAPTSLDNFRQIGFNASWEIDFWGRVRLARGRPSKVLVSCRMRI